MHPSIVVGAFRLASSLARAVPERVADAAAFAIGGALGSIPGERHRIVERNMRRALGPALSGRELRRTVREVYRSYARYYIESFRLPGTPTSIVAERFQVEGYEHVERALSSGKGVILALPHLGGWEWAAFWLTQVQHLQVTAVAEALEPPELFEWFTDLRHELGMHIIPLGPGAGSEVMKAINDGHVVCLLCDRFLAGASVEVEFFGEHTLLPAGPATLALRTGATLLPVAVYFRGDGHLGVVREPIDTTRTARLRDDVARVTQVLANELEALIRVAPEQWHLLQPNWPSDYELLGRTPPVGS